MGGQPPLSSSISTPLLANGGGTTTLTFARDNIQSMKTSPTTKLLAVLSVILVILVAVLVVLLIRSRSESNRSASESVGTSVVAAHIYTQGEIEKADRDLMVANVLFLGARARMMGVTAQHFKAMADHLGREISEDEFERSSAAFNEMKTEFQAASNKARGAYLTLKKMNPASLRLAEVEAVGRVEGGVSPYDE